MTTHHGYTISAAARVLQVNRLTIYRWIECGKIQPIRTATRQLIPHQQIVNIRLGIQTISVTSVTSLLFNS